VVEKNRGREKLKPNSGYTVLFTTSIKTNRNGGSELQT